MTIFYLAVLLGIAYFAILPRPESHFRTVAKTLPIVLLCVFAALSGAWALVVAALALSAVGDALISRSGELAFKLGLWAFLIVLLIYATVFYQAGDADIFMAALWRWAGAAALLVAGIFLLRILWKPTGPLAPAIASYIAAMLAMGLMSLTMPSPFVFIGAVAFLISDALIALETFLLKDEGQKKIASYAVWAFYFLAQCILTLSLVYL
ncbi:lysoplasmalogenase [Rhizobium cremeum]|uniref:lysoplasmalogenase family protein n=1 Tax=Rhizobium cremeum TaxID=2813827 RepID=UPI001FCFE1ED|nr:lysoplasmalogenase family protein [Rhizobium cremeum]MCJ7994290.1 lysoplasmalogenase [Rhizobium cremeum]MCJ7999789.1 lysoplasmalogenase [Rhizobium cremeum]